MPRLYLAVAAVFFVTVAHGRMQPPLPWSETLRMRLEKPLQDLVSRL